MLCAYSNNKSISNYKKHMTPTTHLFTYLNKVMETGWNNPAFSDFGEPVNYTYGEVATQIEKLNLVFKACGVKPGDKIAFCGANSSNWGISFLSVLAYRAIAVSILPDFTGADIEKLVNHSGAKILLAGPVVANKIDAKNMPDVVAVIQTKDFSVNYAATDVFADAIANADRLFAEAHPNGLSAKDVHYHTDSLDELALINYTSGTTSSPKGVMLTYRALSSNVTFGQEWIPNGPGDNVVSMLPLAHMFGMAFEFLYQVAGGTHIYFLPKMTVPVLLKALHDCQPYLMLTVPLMIEKIYKKKIQPTVSKPIIKLLWNVPGIGTLIKNKVRDGLMQAFGGKLNCLIIGGAALNSEVEKCLMDVKFPFLVGYGMTEAAPLIGYVPWQEFAAHSCGRIVDRMEIRIDSEDPANVVGEIQVKGDNVMMGYYKNEEATKAAFTEDGWLKTGDLGVLDAKGNMYIRGRNKNMILGASGQNIYPEEIEDIINAQDGVAESLCVSRDGKLWALVFPDAEFDLQGKSIEDVMADNKVKINKLLPQYSQIFQIELMKEEFEKTPKRSIKRFMYK